MNSDPRFDQLVEWIMGQRPYSLEVIDDSRRATRHVDDWLASCGRRLPMVTRSLSHRVSQESDVRRRCRLAIFLATVFSRADDDSRAVLDAAIQDRDPTRQRERRGAVAALGFLTLDPPTIRQLITLTADSDVGVQAQAIRALGWATREFRAVLPAVKHSLRSPYVSVRKAAIESVSRLAASTRVRSACLIGVVTDDDIAVQQHALQTLKRLGQSSPRMTKAVWEVCQTATDVGVRHDACDALGVVATGNRAIARKLARRLSSFDPRTQKAGIRAIRAIGEADSSILNKMLEIVRNPNVPTENQLTALRAVAQLGHQLPSVAEALKLIAATHPSNDVREEAEFTAQIVEETPDRLIDRRDRIVVNTPLGQARRTQLERVLCHDLPTFGSAALKYVPVLQRMADESPTNREQFDRAIRQIAANANMNERYLRGADRWSPGGRRLHELEVPRERKEPDPPINPVQRVLRGSSPESRSQAARDLGDAPPDPNRVVALSCAARNDPSGVVQSAARGVLEGWCASEEGTRTVLGSLLVAMGGMSSADEHTFRLGKILIYANVRSMTENPTAEDQRIEAATDRIRAAVAGLPNVEEQRKAEVNALVKSVPETTYPEQIQAFTGITHGMRLRIAARLETPLRRHLREETPRVNNVILDRKKRNADLATRKANFADRVTDELCRLGLGLKWDGDQSPCYLSSSAKPPHNRGTYRLKAYGEGRQVGEVIDWFEDSTSRIRQNAKAVDSLLDKLSLDDLLAPEKELPLFPRRSR